VAATLAVALLLAAAAGVVFGSLWTWERPAWNHLFHWGTLLLGGIFGLRAVGDFRWVGFFKRERGGAFAVRDTWIYSPLCALLSAGCVQAAIGARG